MPSYLKDKTKQSEMWFHSQVTLWHSMIRKRTSSDLIPLIYSGTVLHMGKKENHSNHIESKSSFSFLDALLCSCVCLNWFWTLQWYRCHSFPQQPGFYGSYRQMCLHHKFLYATLPTSDLKFNSWPAHYLWSKDFKLFWQLVLRTIVASSHSHYQLPRRM